MASTNVKAKSGNRIAVMFDGKQVGACKSVALHDSYNLEVVAGIGDIHVIEHVPTQAVYSLQIEAIVLEKEQLRSAGITTVDGDDALVGRVFDIVVIGKDTGEEIRKYMGCSYDSGDIRITANQVVSTSASFKALRVSGIGA
ncbi:hypothetical protein [Propionivibrio sp.]|uniref:hypothetical protein n=1 Tax=Propionivibrio sp. TaxID=2212460 RepID=UPI003BF11FC5